jgi:hypothetical protein
MENELPTQTSTLSYENLEKRQALLHPTNALCAIAYIRTSPVFS